MLGTRDSLLEEGLGCTGMGLSRFKCTCVELVMKRRMKGKKRRNKDFHNLPSHPGPAFSSVFRWIKLGDEKGTESK